MPVEPLVPKRSVRAPQDEIIYQIMPIAWRDSNLDTVGSVSTRFGDFGGEFATPIVDGGAQLPRPGVGQ